MANTKIIILGLISILVFMTSCEKEIPIEIDGVEEKVVLNSLFYADSIFSVTLTNSAKIAAGEYIHPIQNAIVQLFEDGQLLEVLPGNGSGRYESSHVSKVGSSYTIEVNSSLGLASASSSIPRMINIISIDTLEIASLVFDSWSGAETVYNSKITFVDPSEDNYYLLRLMSNDTADHYSNYIPLFYYETDYMVLGNSFGGDTYINTYNYLRFTDEEFAATQKTYSFGLRPNNYNSGNVYTLEIYSLHKDFYEFIRTMEVFEYVMYDFFSEPINVHSNVDGGLGIFAGASVIKVPLYINYDEIYY